MQNLQPMDFNIAGRGKVLHNLSVPALVNEALRRGEGTLTTTGALNVITGKYTGRSPDDKFIVDDPTIHDEIEWGEINRPLDREYFHKIKCKMHAYLQNKDLFVFDGIAGADRSHAQRIRVINEYAYQNLFIHQLLVRPTAAELENYEADWTMLCCPGFSCIPGFDGVHSETAIIIDLVGKEILIAGNLYCGEMKKAVFSVMNFVLPREGILSMHCSANCDANGTSALFFGLSGTGKTTLSSSKDRILVGDDEHGWGDTSVFNIEGGCYAKTIDLDGEKEPDIFNAIRFGTVLENVVLDENGEADYTDHTYTYNTRAGYPVEYIPNASATGTAGSPETIIFLTADAFGVIPPISRLSEGAAVYHYISGYTSKVAGTERGISEPVTTFSTMFGAPFFPLKTGTYTALMERKLKESGARVFLVNTGWCGGKAGTVPRMKLKYTRAMVAAAINGELDNVDYVHDDILNLDIPTTCPNVPADVLNPAEVWTDKDAYLATAKDLAARFNANFNAKFAALGEAVSCHGPKAE